MGSATVQPIDRANGSEGGLGFGGGWGGGGDGVHSAIEALV